MQASVSEEEPLDGQQRPPVEIKLSRGSVLDSEPRIIRDEDPSKFAEQDD